MKLPSLIACSLCVCAALDAQHTITERYADGKPQRIYAVDAEGRRDGKFQSFFPAGSLQISAGYKRGHRHGSWQVFAENGQKLVIKTFRNDVLNGPFRSFHENGKSKLTASYLAGKLQGRYRLSSADLSWVYEAKYKAGKLHGRVTIKRRRKIVSKQKWLAGQLVDLDGIQPFPRSARALRRQLAEILQPATVKQPEKRKKPHKRHQGRGGSAAVKPDPLAATRAAALRRLQAYRALCTLRYADMELVPKWNDLCDAAAEVCRANGQISHHPARPAGFDAERYAQGALAASKSNLSAGSGMLRSVDAYMDDSDPRNIDRLGHRRWLLNPRLKRLGIGAADRFSALWCMDASGSMAKGMEAVFYPPRGLLPVDFFGPRHAWCIILLRGQAPRKKSIELMLHELDEYYQAKGEALPMDHSSLAPAAYGAGRCLIFRPQGLQVEVGRKYLLRVSFDAGKSEAFRYVVEFCEAVGK